MHNQTAIIPLCMFFSLTTTIFQTSTSNFEIFKEKKKLWHMVLKNKWMYFYQTQSYELKDLK